MEFSFASDGVNNPYFDRIAHVGAETSVTEVQTCLEFCNIAKGSVFKPGLTFIERNCLKDCAAVMSEDMNYEPPTAQQQ